MSFSHLGISHLQRSRVNLAATVLGSIPSPKRRIDSPMAMPKRSPIRLADGIAGRVTDGIADRVSPRTREAPRLE